MMDDKTKRILDDVVEKTFQAGVILGLAYLVIGVWWMGYIEAASAEELARHESCYQQWDYNIATQESWLKISYCGEQTGNPER